MLSITVKTMDSQSRQFEIPVSTKIKDFKVTIAPSVNVPVDHQRLIYQGRVLPDDFQLTQEHNGKVLHLVQRLPAVIAATSSSSSLPASTAAPAAGGAFNPGQLSQMIFQQAMNGLGNLLVGGSISGNMVPNPSNPNEQIMNIQIDLNGSTAAGSRTSTTSTTSNASPRVNSRAPNRRQANVPQISAPRQQLRAVQRNLRQLDNILNQLESRENAPAAEETTPVQESTAMEEGSGDVYAADLQSVRQDEAMDTSNDAEAAAAGRSSTDTASSQSHVQAESSAASGSSPPSCAAHPSLGELGTFYTRMLQAQRRLEPFINEMIGFLNTDPSFSSTQSPEYRSTLRLLTLTLEGQQYLAEIQRLLSEVVIPLGRTPPRSMLLRASHNSTHAQAAAEARLIHQAVHAGRARLATPRGVNWSRMQRPVGQSPVPAAGATFRPRRMQIPVRQGMQIRWQRPPSAPANVAASVASNDGVPTSTSSSQTGFVSTAPSSGGSTVFSVQPPSYTVQVNATIQPQITFSVHGENRTTTTVTSTAPSSGNTTATQAQQQSSSTTSSTTTSTSQATRTVGVLPNIPGLQSEALTNLMQSVAQTVQNQTAGNVQGITQSGAGVIVVQGPPGGENQIPEDISSIVGQSVFDAMYNQLTGSTQPGSQAGNSPNIQFVVSSAGFSGTPGPATTVQASNSATTTTMTQAQPPVVTAVDATTTNGEEPVDASPGTDTSAAQTTGQEQSSQVPSLSNWETLLMQVRGAANLFHYDLNQRAGEIMRQFGVGLPQALSQSHPTLVRLFNSITSELSCNNLLDAVQGNSAQLGRLRTLVRNWTNEAYFPNDSPTPEQLVRVSGEISESVRELTSQFFANARIVADVDIVESNLSLMRHSIKRLLEIVFYSADAVYDNEIGRHTRYCLSMWIRLNESVLRGGRKELLKLLRNYSQGTTAQTLSGLGIFFRLHTNEEPLDYILNLLTSLQTVNQDQIDQFVLSQAPTIVESDSAIAVETNNEEKKDSTSQSIDEKGEKNSKPKDSSVPQSSAGPSSTSSTSSASVASSKDDWKEKVPPEWVDTIVADAEAQKSMEPQMQFSEAYLAGMPASKRRKVIS